MRVAESATYAPIGKQGGPPEEWLRLFVLPAGCARRDVLRERVIRNCRKGARVLGTLTTLLPLTEGRFGAFAAKLKGISKRGIPALVDAPYLIVLAERKGFPPVAAQSAAHALENMWLTATAEGLGFQLLTAVSQLSDDKAFMSMFGLQTGAWHVECCAVGFSAEPPAQDRNYDIENFVTWMD